MKKRISRILSLVLLVAMVMSLMPTTLAFAEEAPAEEITVPEEGVILPVAGENDPPAEEPEDPFYEDELFYEDDFEDELFYEDDLDAVTDEADDLLADSETSTWVKIDLEDITADDIIAITMTKTENGTTATCALSNVQCDKNPQGLAVVPEGDAFSAPADGNYGWTVNAVEGGYTFSNGSLNLSYGAIKTAQSVRVTEDDAAVWVLKGNYLSTTEGTTTRYLGVWFPTTGAAPTWRHYSGTTNEIKNQQVSFWKLTDGGDTPVEPEDPTEVAAPTANPAGGAVDIGADIAFDCATSGAVIYYCYSGDENRWVEGDSFTVPENAPSEFNIQLQAIYYPTDGDPISSAVNQYNYTIRTEAAISTIAEALAGAENAEFTVKGVVTLVDGRNIYVQDATGGICLYPDTAPVNIELGNTVIGTGVRKTFKGLPELSGCTLTLSEGLTLTAKETTLDAITEADVCTYVKINGLTVKEINGDNTVVTDASGNEMPIYKAKTTEALKAGDTLDFTGAVGIFNTLQLRNTLASEITVQGGETPEDPEPATVTLDKLTEAPKDGDKVVIHNPANNKALGLEEYYYNNKKYELTAVDATPTAEGKLALADGMAYLTVVLNTENKYSFVNEEGKYLEVDGTHVRFVTELNANTLFQLESAGDSYYIKCDTAEYNGNAQYLEYYSGYFTCFRLGNGGPAYEFDFYAEVEPVNTDPVSGLKTGDTVAIYNDGNGKALTATASGTRLAAAAATLGTDGKLSGEGIALLTVTVNDEGQVLFTNEGKYLTSGDTGNSLSFTTEANEYSLWVIEATADGLFYLKNANAAYNGNAQYLEYYNTFTTYKLGNGGAAFAVSFRHIADSTEPEQPTGTTYGLTGTLADGDTVILYNSANGVALGNTITSHKVTGVALTPADGVITTDNTAVAWTVTVNADGTYTFTQGDYTLGGAVSGTYNNLVLTDATYTGWTLTEADSVDLTHYLYFENWSNSYGKFHLEYYNGFTVYATNTPEKNAYGITFYKQGAEPETPGDPTPGEGNTYGLSSTLATGDTVILYNAKNGVGVGNSIASHKITGVALTPVNGVITTDNTAVAWKVTVNTDGTYTFTQGDYTLGGAVSGNYNNLVVTDATYTGWTPTGPDPSDFNYFLSLNDMATNFGKIYLEYYNGFTLYGSTAPDKDAYGITFYKQGAEPETPHPEETGDLVTSLDQLTDGVTVAIYSPGHKTAISTRPNGDWYLKANEATIENGKVVNFTSDYVWQVQKNANGTYTFVSNDDNTKSITVWPSDTYAEVTVNYEKYTETGDNTWTLTPAKTANAYYFSSPSVSGEHGSAYIEAYVRNEFEVFSGYFTSPNSNKFTESEFALQFYLVDPTDAIEAYDDGEWDGVLNKGQSYVFYNANAKSAVGLWKEANYSMDAIPTTIEGGKANAGNGAYVFKVDTMGRYYSFEVNGKFLATNNDEELLFVEPNEDGSAPENAKWFLKQKEGGYIIYNKDASYNGTPVCIEYYSSVFSGWTFSTKNDVGIYLFNFYPLADGIEVREDTVQVPSVKFDCEDTRFFEQDYKVAFTLDDLAESISSITITYTANGQTTTVTEYEASADGKGYSFTIPASALDGQRTEQSFKISVSVTNSYDITYPGEKTVTNVDEPFFEEMTPAPNGQTGDDKRPVISVKIGNAGENPVITMQVNGTQVEAVFENGVLSYQPAENMADGRVTVSVSVTRADQVTAEKSWYFTVGDSEFQKYFGQLHSHTTYSDGSGTLDTALDYISSIPESANVQFVAFTDHSNYFDTTSAANPADALNDQSLMTDASRALWNTYKSTVANFNAEPDQQLIAIAGFEMTWSGGPGHINTFGSDGLVSRNNAALNNKSGDAGMKLYYETVNKGGSMNQFNHPGSTFGNFTDFSYWSEETDAHMFLVEVGNGEGQIGAGGYYPSYEEYTLALDKGWHVAPTNNQDNHKGRWGNANDARDVVLATNLSEEAIYDAIRNLRVYATEDKNLDISFTANGKVMGTIFDERPETLNVVIDLYDPDDTDSVAKVELISDGGVVSYSWTNAEEIATGELTATIDASQHNYYYVRVTQADGDLAVTAPVWVGSTMNMGIASVAVKGSESKEVYKDEPFQLTTTLFNNGESEVTVTSLVYEIKGGEVLATDTTSRKIAAGGTIAVDQALTIDTAKLTTITVTAVIDGTTFTQNIELDVIDRTNENTVTPIADVRAASDPDDTGYRFLIEGVVTSNASGYDKDTAFFDCIYVQDETGGLCCFPVSGEYKIGDKVRIVGHTDFYQGEPELQVKTIEVIGSGTVEPTEITAAQLTDRSAEGKLVTLKGTVESFEEANGLVQTIMVKDAEGNVGRVFIDGYITTGKEVENLAVGATISATGLASYDNTWPDTNSFPRIRIRDRADVVCGTEAPGVEIIGISLGLNGSIDLNIYVKPDAGISAEQLNGLFLLDGEAAELGSPDASGNYKLIVKKDAPTMTAEVELTLSDESIRLLSPAGEEIDSYKTSIFGYLTFAKEYYQNDPDKVALLRLMDVMMAYCYYSQQACTYDTSARAVSLEEIDPSVIADVTADAVNDYTIQLDGAVEGLSFYGTSLIVNSETTYRLYFKLEDGASADDYSFQVNGTDVTAQVKGSYLFVDVVGIVAKNLNKTVTVTVTKGESALTIASAPLSYVRNALNGSQDEKTLNVAKAVFRYWQTAATYFMH